MQQPGGAPPRHQAPATAAEQGPLDWLVPFIPPFLRVNRETRAALFVSLQSLSLAALSAQITAFLKDHGRQLGKYALVAGVWLYGLAWTNRHAPEFAAAYVILTGLGALLVHLYSGDRGDVTGDGISAYSVFNKGGARMLGSLSAEQFEVQTAIKLDPVNQVDVKPRFVLYCYVCVYCRTRSATACQTTMRRIIIMKL